MGARRLGLALLAALVISLGITYVFYVRVMKTQASNRPKMKSVVAAGVALQPGTPITAENLTLINWPDNVALDGLIEKKEDVTGRVLMYSVAANDPVLRRDLASSTSFGLSAKIPDGMRATAVKTNEVLNIAGFIFPGSRVDVLVTLRGENNGASTMTRTVLQNVQVLSTGTKMDPDPNGKPENVTIITLLVTPEESEKLALAENQGTIQFVLRNGGDSASTNTPAIGIAELTGAPKPPVPEPVRTKRAAAAAAVKPPTNSYLVETLANGKITVSKFPVNPE
jgi:pilus assembly protein CpaB